MIPLSDISFDEREEEAVLAVLRSKWLTMGDVTEAFGRDFATFIGTRHAIAVANGTVALQLAYRAVGVGPGDEILVPSLTFVATASAAVALGATVVFTDIVGESDLTVSPVDIEAKIGPRTKAIAVVHYGGHPADVAAVRRSASRWNLAIVEDCAHSPGADLDGVRTGGLGDIGCFSLFSNKNMTTGEGGMVTTNNDELAEKIRLWRSHGMTTLTLDRHRGHSFSYDVAECGHNFRIDELRSAIGRVQLAKLGEANLRRAGLAALYRTHLSGGRVWLPFGDRTEGSVHHIMPCLLPTGVDRIEVMRTLRRAGIQTSIHYPPVHAFTAFRASAGAHRARVPVTEELAPRLLTLPLFADMKEEAVGLVCGRLGNAVNDRARA